MRTRVSFRVADVEANGKNGKTYMQVDEQACPYCGVRIAPEEVIAWRPFSCRSCQHIIEARSRYGGYGCVGRSVVFVLCSAALIAHGTGWFVAIVVGLGTSIAANAVIVQLRKRLWPRGLILRNHILRTEPEGLVPLADFLDMIALADSWTPDFDAKLKMFDSQTYLDDSLEKSGHDAAWAVKDAVQGIERKTEKTEPNFPLEQWRGELRAIARDLRFAAEEYKPKSAS